jgi:hypothetical protein
MINAEIVHKINDKPRNTSQEINDKRRASSQEIYDKRRNTHTRKFQKNNRIEGERLWTEELKKHDQSQ